MAESVQSGLVQAVQVAREVAARPSANGVSFAAFGETGIEAAELERLVQAVPSSVAAALARKTYYFVPLAMAEGRAGESSAHRSGKEETMISPVYTTELADLAICHRNVALGGGAKESEGVFISTRLLNDRFSLAFEFFINVGHAFVEETGVPESFSELAWSQAVADVRGETSQDAWETRRRAQDSLTRGSHALGGSSADGRNEPKVIDERSRNSYYESSFSDSLAVYMLSLAVDFDYHDLREREYPLLAAPALAERLRHVASLFPPNSGYEFQILYRRKG
jgi:hypothetical protein